MAFLLRIALPDRPGALGSVATALGTVGADIVSLDVVERSADRAVDDLVVELPLGGLADALVSAAASVPGVRVVSIRPYAAMVDPYRELELLDAIVADPIDADPILADGLVRIFRAGWCLVVSFTGANTAKVDAASQAAPEQTELPFSGPIRRATGFATLPQWAPQPWHTLGTELAVSPLGERAVLVGRPAMAWLPAEVARLAHLCSIVRSVLPAT
jgi:hypothetical protein